MKIILVLAACTVLTFPINAVAKGCSGDPTALSRKHFASGSFDGTTVMSLPNGCKMTCTPGDSSRGTKRHCKWV
jgi:hypothetical protein